MASDESHNQGTNGSKNSYVDGTDSSDQTADSGAESKAQIERRDVLKYTSGALLAPISESSQTATVNKSDDPSPDVEYTKQTLRHIQLKITAEMETETENRILRGASDTFVPNLYSEENRAFIVSSKDRDLLNSNCIITTPFSTTGINRNQTSIDMPLTMDSDYNGFATETYESPNNDSDYEFGVSYDDMRTVIKTNSEQILTVRSGEKRKESLDERQAVTHVYEEREIENPREGGDDTLTRKFKVDESSVTITPELSVRDLGTVPVFAASEATLFPKSMPNARILINGAEDSEEAQLTNISSDIVAVKEVAE